MTEKQMRVAELRTVIKGAKKVMKTYTSKSHLYTVAAFALETAEKELMEIV